MLSCSPTPSSPPLPPPPPRQCRFRENRLAQTSGCLGVSGGKAMGSLHTQLLRADRKVCGLCPPGQHLGNWPSFGLWALVDSLVLGPAHENSSLLLPLRFPRNELGLCLELPSSPFPRCYPERTSTVPLLWSRSLIIASLAAGQWWVSAPFAPWRTSCVTRIQQRVHPHRVAQVRSWK